MNKLELVDRLVTELGLCPKEVMAYWQNKKSVIPKKHRTHKKSCAAKEVTAPKPEESVSAIDIPANDKVFIRIKKILMDKLDIEEKDITPATAISALGADSLDAVEITMEYEREFNINIPDADSEKFIRVQDAWEYISSQIKS